MAQQYLLNQQINPQLNQPQQMPQPQQQRPFNQQMPQQFPQHHQGQPFPPTFAQGPEMGHAGAMRPNPFQNMVGNFPRMNPMSRQSPMQMGMNPLQRIGTPVGMSNAGGQGMNRPSNPLIPNRGMGYGGGGSPGPAFGQNGFGGMGGFGGFGSHFDGFLPDVPQIPQGQAFFRGT